jgi:hypothetical protein
MAIVLAIEPDRRQAAHLTTIVRHQVGAELLLADTTEGALDAIGDRIPDLVLVPALLSPQDDAALAAALRVIAAAAHVRTLTIPVLSSGTKRAAIGGMLAKWRKNRTASPEPEGCDPAVFGEQISTYLREAAAERAQIEDDLIGSEPVRIAPPVAARTEAVAVKKVWAIESIASVEPIAPAETIAPAVAEAIVPVVAEAIVPVVAEAIEPVAAVQYPYSVEPVQEIAHRDAFEELERIAADVATEPVVEAVERWTARPIDELVEEPVDEPIELDEQLIDLSGQLEDLSEETDRELFDGDQVRVYTIGAEADEPRADTLDLLPSLPEPEAVVAPLEAAIATAVPVVELEAEPLVAAEPLIDTRFAEPPVAEPPVAAPMFAESQFVEPPEPPRPDIQPWVPMFLTPGRMWPAMEGMPAETPAPRAEPPDWIELVASLRQDLERRRADPAAAAEPIALRPSNGPKADVLQLVKKPRPHAKKVKPVQDEWGFFDPEQCGFSTLLAKLNEITAET